MKSGLVKYTRRANLGDYEHQELTMEIFCEDGDNVDIETINLMERVSTHLGCKNKSGAKEMFDRAVQATSNMAELKKAVEEPVDEPKPRTKKKSKSSTSKAKKVSKKSKEKSVDEKPKAEVKEEPKKADVVSKESSEPKKERLGYLKYDRSKTEHKKEFGKLLSEAFPSWKADADLKAKAKSASVSLEGEVMYEKSGEISKDFMNALLDAMA